MSSVRDSGEAPGGSERDKIDYQLELIRAELAREGVDLEVAWLAGGTVDYLYQAGVILVRDSFLDRVRNTLDEASDRGQRKAEPTPLRDSGFIDGATLVSLGPYGLDVPTATLLRANTCRNCS